MQQTFAKSYTLDDESILATIADYHNRKGCAGAGAGGEAGAQATGYVLDPHSAVAVTAAERAGTKGTIAFCTAHWCKF